MGKSDSQPFILEKFTNKHKSIKIQNMEKYGNPEIENDGFLKNDTLTLNLID